MNIAIIQARMGSSRLPGKVLMKINGKPILEHLINRVSTSTLLDEIIVATSINKEDDQIEEFCKNRKIKYHRGSEDDVLTRFYDAARMIYSTPGTEHNEETVIRITADCPLHHGEVIDFAINEFKELNVGYFSNSNEPPVLEDGCDTEVFSFLELKKAYRFATKPFEREHVTPYIKKKKWDCDYKKFNHEWNFKLSVDNENDFKAVTEIFNAFTPDELFGIDDIIQLLKRKPEILAINRGSIINEKTIGIDN